MYDHRINGHMLNGGALPKKRRIFSKRRLGITTRFPLVILGTSLGAALVMGLILAGSEYRTGLGHAGQHISQVESDKEKL
jgi:hypothetical protein